MPSSAAQRLKSAPVPPSRVQEHERRRFVEAAARRIGGRQVQLAVTAVDVHAPELRRIRFRAPFRRRHTCPAADAAISWCIKEPVMPKYSRTFLAIALLSAPSLLGRAARPTPRPTRRFTTGSSRSPAAGAAAWKIRCPGPPVTVRYEVVSGGKAVIEYQNPGQSFEMVTVYYLAGGKLHATHYCGAGNQPAYKLGGESTAELAEARIRRRHRLRPGARRARAPGRDPLHRAGPDRAPLVPFRRAEGTGRDALVPRAASARRRPRAGTGASRGAEAAEPPAAVAS